MLFQEQIARKPNKYAWTQDFIDKIWAGFWTPAEFDFKADYGQFKGEMTAEEQAIIVRTLSAIGQIEIAVKRFWAQLGDHLPHPSMSDLGYAMANTEVIHNQAYEKLLDTLRLGHVFEENLKEPVVKGRVEYLRKYLKKRFKDDRKQYVYAIILFTLFVENASLFSQFYVVLWFNRFKNVLRDTAQQVQYTRNEECYSAETEVLTPDGWRRILDMKIGDPIFQFLNSGELELTTVQGVIRKTFKGDLLEFSRKGNRCLVTPAHDMIVHYADDKPNTFRRVKAADVKFHKKMMIPRRAARGDGTIDVLSDTDRLRIAVQADGSALYWVDKAGNRQSRGMNGGANYLVALKRERKIQRLREIVARTGVRHSESVHSDGYVHFRLHLNEKPDLKRLDWIDLSNKSSTWCRAFIEEAACWDGYITPTAARGYSSSVRENIDIVQAIGVLAGYHAKIISSTDGCWKLEFTDPNALPISHGVKRRSVAYEGEVGCVSVPSGMILTRLGDDTFIAGNCLHAQVGIKLINTLREEYPELFDDELKARIREETYVAFKSEAAIIDWMIGDYADKNISADILKSYIANRLDVSLKSIGFDEAFGPVINQDDLSKTTWMDEELYGDNVVDFFHKKPTDYAKNNKTYSVEELF